MFSALIWRPLRNDAGRTLLSLLAIALGVAVVIAIRIANRGAIASFQQTTQVLAGDADLLVSGPQPLPATLLPRLFPVNAQAEILPYLDRRVYDPQARDTLEILGVDFVAAATSALTPQSSALSPLFLPRSYATLHHLRIGDHLDLVTGGAAHSFQIAALVPGDLALLDLPDALATFETNAAPSFDGLRVILAPGASLAAVAQCLRERIPPADHVAPPRARDQQDAKMLAAFRANLAALSYVSLLVGIFLIYNTVSISVVRRRVAIATVRALGATRGRVLRLFLAEGVVLAGLGGLLGLGLGWLLADGALVLIARTINSLYAATHPTRAVLAGSDALWALGLAAGAGIVAAWAPARQAASVPPAQALRPGGAEAAARARTGLAWAGAVGFACATLLLAKLPEPGGVPVWGFASALAAVLAWACAAPPLLALALPRLRRAFFARGRLAAGLAAGGLAGALRRSAVLTVALATAIGVMLGVAIMVGSFRQTVQLWIGQQLQADVFVRAADWDRDRPAPLGPALVAAAASTPGAVAVEFSHTQAWEYQGQPISLNTRWGAPASRRPWTFLAGTSGPAIISEPFARRFRLAPGDAMTLTAPKGPVHVTVAGVFYDYASDRGLVVLDPAIFARGFGVPAPTELGLYAAFGVSTAALRRGLSLRLVRRGLAGGLSINDNASLRAEAMRVFDQTFRITYALELITLLVAILGVGNTLLAVVLERGREFAILRFLGATRGQIRAILVAESGLVATLALAVGWGMGLVLAVILVRVINVQSFGWTIQVHLPYVFLASASALVWLSTLAAGWLPARAAQRQDPLEAVAAE